MMDCRKVKQLLPLFVGQDLPDAVSATDVASHLKQCSQCEKHRLDLQTSLDVLQGSSEETLLAEVTHRSVWPKLVSRISEWESTHRQDRFNGWIPATVMALAVALMIAVSLPSIRDELFEDGSKHSNTADLFDPQFNLDDEFPSNNRSKNKSSPQRRPLGTPVIFKPDQW